MVQAIENNKQGDEAKAIRDAFVSVNNDWELQYANIDASVEFNVDRPFGVDSKRMPDAVWLFQCNAFPFDGKGGIDPDSAHTILTVINHCHDLVKSGIEDLGKTAGDQTARKRLIDQSYFRLSNIYYINDALRCVILERAVAMRQRPRHGAQPRLILSDRAADLQHSRQGERLLRSLQGVVRQESAEATIDCSRGASRQGARGGSS